MTITANGYESKLINDIIVEIKQELIDAGYEGLNLEPESFEGHLLELVSRRVYVLEQKLKALYNTTPATAVGPALDSFCLLKNIKRFSASHAITNLTFTGLAATVIPVNTLVTDRSGNRYSTLSLVELTEVCTNKVYIGFSRPPTAGSWTLRINSTSYTFNFTDTDMTAHPLISSYTGSYAQGFVCTCSVIPVSTAVTRSGAFDATPLSSIMETEDLFRGSVPAIAVDAGSFTSGAVSIVTAINPPEGFRFVYNEDAAVPGRARETDEELFARFNATPGAVGGSINGIMLRLPEMINEGRTDDLVTQVKIKTHFGAGPSGAPNPLEIFVVGGVTVEQRLAEIIRLELVSGGITLLGDEVFTVLDVENEEHESRFSRPAPVDIYVRMNIEIDSTFPGADAIKDALVEYGNRLGIGVEVIRIPGVVFALGGIPGILDVPSLELSDDGITYVEDNIAVDPYQISSWEAVNIEVNIV